MSDCGAGGSTGWTYSKSGYTGNTTCGKCTEKNGCGSGFSTSIQSVSDCGAGGATGWTYSTSGYNGNTTCGKCTEKNGCGSGYAVGAANCGSGGSAGWTLGSAKSGYYGNTQCSQCVAKTCASYGWIAAGSRNTTCYTYSSDSKQTGNTTTTCYLKTGCKSSDGHYDSYDSNCYIGSNDADCSGCYTVVAKTCANYSDYPLSSCPTGYTCTYATKCAGTNRTCYALGSCNTSAGYYASQQACLDANTGYKSCKQASSGNGNVSNCWVVNEAKTCGDWNYLTSSQCDSNCNTCTAKSVKLGATTTNCYEATAKTCDTYDTSSRDYVTAGQRNTSTWTYTAETKNIGNGTGGCATGDAAKCYYKSGCANSNRCGANCDTTTTSCSDYKYTSAPSNGTLNSPCTVKTGGGTLTCSTGSTYYGGYTCNSGYCKNGTSSSAACAATNQCSSYGYSASNLPAHAYLTGDCCTQRLGGTNEQCYTGVTKCNGWACKWPYVRYNGACVLPSSGYSFGIVLPWSVNGGEYGQHVCATIGETSICSTDLQGCLATCAGGNCDGTYYSAHTCGSGLYGAPAGAVDGEYVESGFTFGYCNSSGGPQNMFEQSFYKYGGIGKFGVENGSFAGSQSQVTGIDASGNCVSAGITAQDYTCNSGYCKDSTTTTKCTKTSGCSGYAYSNAPSNGSLTGDSCTAITNTSNGCGRTTYRTGYSCNTGYCKNPSSSTAACYQTNYAINHGYPYYGMTGVKLGVGSTSTNYTGSGTAACTQTTVYSSFRCAWPYVKVGDNCELSSEGLSYNYYGCNSSYIAYGLGGGFAGWNGVPAYMFAGDAGFRNEVLKNCAGGEIYEYNGTVQCSCSYSNSSVRGYEISGVGQFIWSPTAMTYTNAMNFCANNGAVLLRLGTWNSSYTTAQIKEFYNLCHNKISGVTKVNHAWTTGQNNASLNASGTYASGSNNSTTDKLCVFCQRY